jgi:uncharacterized protein (TIGR00369 family)
MSIPDGFEPHFRQSPLTAPWEPLYSRRQVDRVTIGLEVRQPHCNSRGLLHGGLISALADNGMGLSCVAAAQAAGQRDVVSMITIGLQVDFLGQARMGQWLQFDVVRVGRTLSLAACFVRADGDVVAKANGTFRSLDKAIGGARG